MRSHFEHFVAIDWSGAQGERHRGIAVAIANAGRGAPRIVRQGQLWSRQDVLDWLRHDLPEDALVGLDLGTSLPFESDGGFFPGWEDSPADARDLWRMIDRMCGQDAHLAAQSFVDHPVASQYFRRHGQREGRHFHLPDAPDLRGRFRETEKAQAARKNCKPYSNFNLVGAAQVGKSSLTGMRVLHRLGGAIPVWPIDEKPDAGSLIVEIYTAIAAIDAGRTASASKMRTIESLNAALAHENVGSETVPGSGPIDDHSADALLTAAWLRRAAERPELWVPDGMTAQIARTEGWTFGVG